jgi:hypothetical protein
LRSIARLHYFKQSPSIRTLTTLHCSHNTALHKRQEATASSKGTTDCSQSCLEGLVLQTFLLVHVDKTIRMKLAAILQQHACCLLCRCFAAVALLSYMLVLQAHTNKPVLQSTFPANFPAGTS